MGTFQPIKVSASQLLSTLAADTGVLGTITSDTASEGYWMNSMDINISWNGATSAIPPEGPIDVYIANSDWTLAEVEEFIEVATGFNRGDLLVQERQARGRSIRKIGQLTADENNLNDGRPTRVKFKQYIAAGDTLNLVFYNQGVVLTTGSEMSWSGLLYGNWAN